MEILVMIRHIIDDCIFFQAGKRKREEMQNVLQAIRKQQKAKETKKE